MTAKKSPTFESSLKRLEAIVEKLEQGDVALDDVMKLYEEGVALSKQCLDHLQKAEVTLKRLSKDVNGTFELFDEKVDT
jgi:exodeoxyribonuclease VII small subunit